MLALGLIVHGMCVWLCVCGMCARWPRYANRIPLLFEAGADVVTRTAMKRIRWSNYKIDQKKDKITVFVSLVSTKIPFKVSQTPPVLATGV